MVQRLDTICGRLETMEKIYGSLTEAKRREREIKRDRTRKCRAKQKANYLSTFDTAPARGWISMIWRDPAFVERMQYWAKIGVRVLQRFDGGRDFVRWVTHDWMYNLYKPQLVTKTDNKLHFWMGNGRPNYDVSWGQMFGSNRHNGTKAYEIGWFQTHKVWGSLLMIMSELPEFRLCNRHQLNFLKILGALHIVQEEEEDLMVPVPKQYDDDGNQLFFNHQLLSGTPGKKVYARMRPMIESALTACKHGIMKYQPGELEAQKLPVKEEAPDSAADPAGVSHPQ